MKASVVFICLLVAAVVFIMPVIVSSEPVKITTTIVRPTPTLSGEVEFPIVRHFTPTPTPTHTTVTASPTPTHTIVTATKTPTHTTVTASPTTTVPVVTVTVFVYPYQNVYVPYYYYPPYYRSPTGSITVTSDPSGATVILDGYNYGTTPNIFTGLMAGYHTVEVDYPGYEAYITNIYVDYNQNQEVFADLTGLVSYGSLFIDSTPRGADVYVDGNYQGTSPVTVSALSDGAHQVELHLAGYEVLTSTQYVTAGQGTVAYLVLTPYSSSAVYGSIDIASNIPGALVYLDGVYKGTAQSGNTFNIISVGPGAHTVFLHLPGYSDITQTVEVYAGQIADVNAVFTQPAGQAGTATGSIVVTSVPSGAQVSVDNLFRGVTPVTIYNVAPGSHVVNLHMSGYNDWSTSVDVPANQVVPVPATLVPVSGTATAPTRAGLSVIAPLGALAAGAIMIAVRIRK